MGSNGETWSGVIWKKRPASSKPEQCFIIGFLSYSWIRPWTMFGYTAVHKVPDHIWPKVNDQLWGCIIKPAAVCLEPNTQNQHQRTQQHKLMPVWEEITLHTIKYWYSELASNKGKPEDLGLRLYSTSRCYDNIIIFTVVSISIEDGFLISSSRWPCCCENTGILEESVKT